MVYVPFFEVVEGLVEDFIVPFVRDQLVGVVEDGEGVDQMCAQVGVYVSRQVFTHTRPILGPVGEVAHQFGGRHCWKGSTTHGWTWTLHRLG